MPLFKPVDHVDVALEESSDTPAHVVKVSDQSKSTWVGRWLWDTADLDMKERKLLFKVDMSLLVFASLGYFIKNLDQTNLSNAFLSGLKEDLAMTGNQLVTATSIWTAGYVVGQLPCQYILTFVSPRWVIPSLELGWGILTLATYCVNDYRVLYALRFLIGLAESAFYPSIHYLLGSWYTPRELAKRTSLFYVAGSAGTMFSGILQAAAYRNLDGVHGLAGWRWMFIVDAIITIPIAILGFIFLPGVPWNTKANFWLTQDDVDLAQARMKNVGRKEHVPWTKKKFFSLFKTWHMFVLPPAYMLYNNSIAQSPAGYWLKSFNATPPPVPGRTFSVSDINQLPLPGTAIFIVLAMVYAWWSDALNGLRWPFMVFGSVLNIIVNAILVSTPLYTNIWGRYGLYLLLPAQGAIGAILMNWATEITGFDNEKRAMTIATMNALAYTCQAVAPNFVWKTTDFPKAHRGHLWSIALTSILLPNIALIWYLQRRDQRKRGLLEERRQSEVSDDELDSFSLDEKKELA